MNFQKYFQTPVFETIGFRMFPVASIVRLTMFVVDVFIHFHTCQAKIATLTYLHKYLKRTLLEEKKVQTKISSFLKPTTEGI